MLACVENNGSDVHTRDTAAPRSGQGWFYLVRAADQHCSFGTWESESPSQAVSRDAGVLASPNACP